MAIPLIKKIEILWCKMFDSLFKEEYNSFSNIVTTGPDAIIFVENDDSQNGDGTPSIFVRRNNTLYYLVTVEQ